MTAGWREGRPPATCWMDEDSEGGGELGPKVNQRTARIESLGRQS